MIPWKRGRVNSETALMARVARIGVGAGKTLDGHHAVFTYTGVNSGIPTENAPSIIGRSYTITAEVEVPEGGGSGMIATEGGRFGGYGLYLLKGKSVFTYNFMMLPALPLGRTAGAFRGRAHDSCSTSHMTDPASRKAAPVS
jgi:hypothetical protein